MTIGGIILIIIGVIFCWFTLPLISSGINLISLIAITPGAVLVAIGLALLGRSYHSEETNKNDGKKQDQIDQLIEQNKQLMELLKKQKEDRNEES